MIALEDLKDMTEQEVIDHIASEYSGKDQYDSPSNAEIKEAKKLISQHEIMIAYESVGSWGCDSSSFFLLKHKETGKLFEIHGSHCSCYGFEGQLDLEETTLESLKLRIAKGGSIFYCGGYDENETENQRMANSFIESL